MALSENKIKQLDQEILNLMLTDFEYACHITKVDKMQAFVCLQISKGKSNGEIATILNINRQNVAKRAKKCKCD